ncbi:MAG: ParB/RepB/Spo0J family partition protein [Chloroherpetonaceae bacterium]|nr:ParB/RepB/Spo0J family partition protein [Chthonomonadaceae bacterium]MDW8207998.1 ParB/RepB/Spo0J family partition protein [Chloroherpetonaceae bacterium]
MEKKGLGRGLAALIPEAGLTAAQNEVHQVPLSQIRPNPYQPRVAFDPEKLAELVESIRVHGVLQPVLLRRVGIERYELVAGERRLRAAELAGLATVPALIRELTERDQLEIAIVENLQREDIGPLETARAFQRLKEEFGLSLEEIARRTGKARSSISNLLRLLSLPEEVLHSLEVREITEGHARALLLLAEPWRQSLLWRQVVQERLSVRSTEERARKLQQEAEQQQQELTERTGVVIPTGVVPRTEAALDPNEQQVLERLQEILGTRVTVRRQAKGAGRIEILFYSQEEYERLVELLLQSGDS